MKKTIFDYVGKVRKSLTMLGIVLSCAMAASVFTSCGSDDDDNPAGPVKDTTAAAVVIKANFTIPEDILNNCNVTLKYNNGTEEKTESITETVCTKIIKANLPVTISVSPSIKLKDGGDISKVTQSLSKTKYQPSAYLVNAAGDSLTTTFITPPTKETISFYEDGDGEQTYEYSFNAAGIIYSSSDGETNK